jgi:hypothetical protein
VGSDKARDRVTLRLDTEARFALRCSGNSDVGDQLGQKRSSLYKQVYGGITSVQRKNVVRSVPVRELAIQACGCATSSIGEMLTALWRHKRFGKCHRVRSRFRHVSATPHSGSRLLRMVCLRKRCFWSRTLRATSMARHSTIVWNDVGLSKMA